MWLGLFRLSFLSPSSDRWILHCRRADHFPNPDQHSQNRFPEPRSISTVKTGALGYLFSDDDESIAEPVKKQGKKKTGGMKLNVACTASSWLGQMKTSFFFSRKLCWDPKDSESPGCIA